MVHRASARDLHSIGIGEEVCSAVVAKVKSLSTALLSHGRKAHVKPRAQNRLLDSDTCSHFRITCEGWHRVLLTMPV